MSQTLCSLLIHCAFHKKGSALNIRKDDQLCKLTSTNLPIVWLRCENYRVTTCLLYGCIIQANEYQLAYCMFA